MSLLPLAHRSVVHCTRLELPDRLRNSKRSSSSGEEARVRLITHNDTQQRACHSTAAHQRKAVYVYGRDDGWRSSSATTEGLMHVWIQCFPALVSQRSHLRLHVKRICRRLSSKRINQMCADHGRRTVYESESNAVLR